MRFSLATKLKVASDSDSFCDFSRILETLVNKDPHCGFAGDGDVCNRKSRRFAIAIFGANRSDNQGPLNGGVSNGGGFPIWTRPSFLSFFVLFCPFWDFPDFSGIFPICSGWSRGFSRFVPFLFLGLLRAPTRNSPERVRDTIWTFPEKSEKHPGLETPRFSFSQDNSSVAPHLSKRQTNLNATIEVKEVLLERQQCGVSCWRPLLKSILAFSVVLSSAHGGFHHKSKCVPCCQPTKEIRCKE